MRRREFVTAICGAALVWPFEASSQNARRIPVVSVLWHADRERELANPFFHWFRDGFAEVSSRGYVGITASTAVSTPCVLWLRCFGSFIWPA